MAAAFVAAARGEPDGAELRDVGGPTVHTDEVIAAITAAAPGVTITYDPVELPFPADTGDHAPATPLEAGVADAVGRFRELLARGLVAQANQ